MNTAKVYQDSEGNDCTIHHMVEREPGWAANRIQHGERLEARLKRVAALAHSGGLIGLDETQTLQAIRRLSLPFWSAAGTENDLRARAQDAIEKAGSPTPNGLAKRQP